MGRLPQALAAYDRAVGADPEHVDVWLERGRTLLQSGLRADAAGALLRFLDLCSSSHPARRKAEELLAEARGPLGAPAPAEPAPIVEPPRPEPSPEPEAAIHEDTPPPRLRPRRSSTSPSSPLPPPLSCPHPLPLPGRPQSRTPRTP